MDQKVSTEQPLSPQDCLVAVMIATSASDGNMTSAELLSITRIIDSLPAFDGYDADRLQQISSTVLELFEEEDGLDALFGLIKSALPEDLYETAYALACDVVASDRHAEEPELRLLEEIRDELALDRLHAAAIERGARARFRSIAPLVG
ncbi:MAG: tellurite resistance TerB family protein [Pseudomonadota bacterium]